MMKMGKVRATTIAVLAALATVFPLQSAMASSSPTVFGMNVVSWTQLVTAEKKLGQQAGVVGLYRDFGKHSAFPLTEARNAAARGSQLLIAWEPWDSERGTIAQPDMTPATVLAGNYNQLLDSWASSAKTFGKPVMIRFAPEMNGDWRPWSPGVAGGTTTDFNKMWRYVVDRFDAAGVTNVRWVWSPYVEVAESVPMKQLYPGDAYVDYVAIDGFNWGSTRVWGWQSYDDIFASSVARLAEVAPGKPWMIAEVGCAPGGKKAEWTQALFTRAQKDGAAAVVWFEVNKETDWRVTADKKTTQAVARLLSNTGWLTTSTTALT